MKLRYLWLLAGMSLASCGGSEPEPPPKAKTITLFVAHGQDAMGLNGSISAINTSVGLIKKIGIKPNNGGDIAIDRSNKELLTVDDSRSTIKIYSVDAAGNPPPLRTISGYPAGYVGFVTVDPKNAQIIAMTVTSRFGGINFDFFDRLSNGNATAAKRISTNQQFASSFALDSTHNEIIVVNSSSAGNPSVPATTAAINVYAQTATGATTPLRKISGDQTGLVSPNAIAVDADNNELFVVDSTNNSIRVYSRMATGNVAPVRVIAGPATGLSTPSSIALDLTNHLVFVANSANNSVTAYPQAARGDVVPVKTFSQPLFDLAQPTSIAILTD